MSKRIRPGRHVLRLSAAFLVVACGRAPAASPPPDYNVVLISVDTLRPDRLNCYGYRARETSPNIDALARDGILFETLIAASPWTTPSQMSLLTSLYPSAHGVTQSFNEPLRDLFEERMFKGLPEDRITLAEVLQANGFATGAFTGGASVDPKIGFGQGFALYDTSMYKLNDANMGRMCEWIDRNDDGRFFLFWHTYEIHTPYLQTDFLAEVLPEHSASVVRREIDELAADPEFTLHRHGKDVLIKLLERRNAFDRDVCEALYVSCIRSADRWVGLFLRALRKRGLYDRTLVIFTSDHGEEFADHRADRFYGGHGYALYEEQVRVPLIMKLPRQAHAGTRVAALGRTIDIMPTILDVTGIHSGGEQMQGRSLRPLWEGRETDLNRTAISESLSDKDEKKSIRTARYKYIFSIDAHTVRIRGRRCMPKEAAKRELYDLQADPEEERNLLRSSGGAEMATLADELDRKLREFVAAQDGQARKVQLDQQTIDRIKALGYVK